MREIKFRVWNTVAKCFYPREHFGIDMDGVELQLMPECSHYKKPFLRNMSSQKSMIFTQFTGIYDKNGKEIWEGDIVVKRGYIWFDKGKPNYRGTVEWIYSQWQVVAHCVNHEKRGISDGINEGFNDDGIEEGKRSKWEVLGNVWEHPELVKA